MHAYIATFFLQQHALCKNQREKYNSSLVFKVKLAFVLNFVQKNIRVSPFILKNIRASPFTYFIYFNIHILKFLHLFCLKTFTILVLRFRKNLIFSTCCIIFCNEKQNNLLLNLPSTSYKKLSAKLKNIQTKE